MSNSIAESRFGDRVETRQGMAGLPLLSILASFPLAFFSGALVTDLAYLKTANMMWTDFSAWLLAAGLAIGVVAALVGLLVLIVNRRVRRARPVWPAVVGCVSVLVIALFDNFVHSRDAWTSVVPTGLILSAVNAVLIVAVAWYAFAVAYGPSSARLDRGAR